MLVEMRHSVTQVLLDRFELGDPPMPGQWFLHQQTSYLVMQRKHRYKLHSGRYELSSVVLLVKSQKQPADARLVGHGWRGWVEGSFPQVELYRRCKELLRNTNTQATRLRRTMQQVS